MTKRRCSSSKNRLFLIALIFMILFSGCGSDIGKDNPFIPTQDINIERNIKLYLTPAFSIIGTGMSSIIRLNISNIHVSGIYCVSATLILPDGFSPETQEIRISSIVGQGSYPIDFPVKASKTPSLGNAIAIVKWSDDSSCSTTQYIKQFNTSVFSDVPWDLTVNLATSCAMDTGKKPVFQVAAYETWRFTKNQIVSPPYSYTFKIHPTPTQYVISATWFCFLLAGPTGSSVGSVTGLPKSGYKTVEIVNSGITVTIGDDDVFHDPVNPDLTPESAPTDIQQIDPSMLQTIEAAAFTPTPTLPLFIFPTPTFIEVFPTFLPTNTPEPPKPPSNDFPVCSGQATSYIVAQGQIGEMAKHQEMRGNSWSQIPVLILEDLSIEKINKTYYPDKITYLDIMDYEPSDKDILPQAGSIVKVEGYLRNVTQFSDGVIVAKFWIKYKNCPDGTLTLIRP